MKWEINRKEEPKVGDVRYKTRFAFLPTRVLSKITMTDHMVWLQLYLEEQEYMRIVDFDVPFGFEECWITTAKTIHV